MEHFNQSVFLFIHQFAGRSSFADAVGIFLAEYLPYVLLLGFFILIYGQKGPRRKWYLFGEGALGVILARGIITESIRFFYHHPRPFVFYGFPPLLPESSWSFPSGHATFYFALATTVWFLNRKWGAWYFVVAAAMSVARVYAGVHWPLDVIGGAIIGIVCGMFVHHLLRKSREELAAGAGNPAAGL